MITASAYKGLCYRLTPEKYLKLHQNKILHTSPEKACAHSKELFLLQKEIKSDPPGFEPGIYGLEGRRFVLAKPRAQLLYNSGECF
jgi:hypothetical protein